MRSLATAIATLLFMASLSGCADDATPEETAMTSQDATRTNDSLHWQPIPGELVRASYSHSFSNRYAEGWLQTVCNDETKGRTLHAVDMLVNVGRVEGGNVTIESVSITFRGVEPNATIFSGNAWVYDQRGTSLDAIQLGSRSLTLITARSGSTHTLNVNRTFHNVDSGHPIVISLLSAAEARVASPAPSGLANDLGDLGNPCYFVNEVALWPQ